MEVAGSRTEVFEGSEGNDASAGAETLLGGSTLTLAPLLTSPARRSQPIVITSNRCETHSHACDESAVGGC